MTKRKILYGYQIRGGALEIIPEEQRVVQMLFALYSAGASYVPSAEVIRLNNAINRGLEQPDSPEAVMALILQGAAARYDCCPQPISECEPSDCPVEVDWLRFRRVVSYITVASDATVSLTFTDDNFTGKDK